MRSLAPLICVILSATAGFGQGSECDTLENCQKALEANPGSSLTHYRLAEILSSQKNYQSAALEFFQALKGDLEPKWTEVWSHVSLGKIFDRNGERDRAVREYRLAEQAGDDTRGALGEAAKYLESPCGGEQEAAASR